MPALASVLIIGAGGVGAVVAQKSAAAGLFDSICIASRTESKCEAIAERIAHRTAGVSRAVRTAAVDADEPAQVVRLIESVRPDVVVNVALPYQDLSIMEACLQTRVHYVDTANYEPPDEAEFSYRWQWPFHDRFAAAGITALLGSGFDPGVTNVFCAYAAKHLFDSIETIDILDANGGDHGLPFATNFNPEINIREITAAGRYWEGEWKKTDPMAVHQTFDFPEIGEREMYLLYHEEMESLIEHIPGLRRIRFWMTFSTQYLTHLEVLQNVGLTSIEPIDFGGTPVVPLQFLKAVLPDPASLGVRTHGKTNIGIVVDGMKDGRPRRIHLYNVCDHQACYAEVQSQAISYTTGVPAMIGARLVADGTWQTPGVWNMEQFDPDPFMELLGKHGLPWTVRELDPAAPSPLVEVPAGKATPTPPPGPGGSA